MICLSNVAVHNRQGDGLLHLPGFMAIPKEPIILVEPFRFSGVSDCRMDGRFDIGKLDTGCLLYLQQILPCT